MTIYANTLPGAASLADWAGRTNITEKAKQRLKTIDWLRQHKGNVSLAARHFGLDRKTVRVWRDRLKDSGIRGLNDRSHKPKNVRKPSTDWSTVSEIVSIRKEYPAWSKYKIHRILLRKNIDVSESTVGRVLKRKGLIGDKASKKRSKAAKSSKKRFPKGFKIAFEGDMVQMDTKHVNLTGASRIYQFTAIDVLSKRRVLRYYPSLSSMSGAKFLRECLSAFPFRIKAVQTDNGSEFQKHFDALCKELNMPHYFIYPRTPKQNTYVEISHAADQREFYSKGNTGSDIKATQKRLSEWEYTWNYIRPHQSLGYLTPEEYSNKYKFANLPTKDVITLQS